MIRRILEYLAIRFHVIEGKPQEDVITMITRLLPIIMGCAVILYAVKHLGIEIKIPWYLRAWYKIRHYCQRGRFALIGW